MLSGRDNSCTLLLLCVQDADLLLMDGIATHLTLSGVVDCDEHFDRCRSSNVQSPSMAFTSSPVLSLGKLGRSRGRAPPDCAHEMRMDSSVLVVEERM